MSATANNDPITREERLQAALAKCSPSQRQWLGEIPTCNWRIWAAGNKLGISPDTIRRWLKLPHIHEARRLLEEDLVEAIGVTAARITLELSRIAFADLRDLLHTNGSLKQPTDWCADAAAAVSSIDIETHYEGGGEKRERVTITRIRFTPKTEALITLARISKLLVTRTEMTGHIGAPLPSGVLVVPNVVDETTWAKMLAIQQADLADRERAAAGLS